MVKTIYNTQHSSAIKSKLQQSTGFVFLPFTVLCRTFYSLFLKVVNDIFKKIILNTVISLLTGIY